MSNPDYIIRNYQSADFNKFVSLRAEVEKLEPSGRRISPEAIALRLGRPNFSAEKDLLIAEIAGSIVGYLDISLELAIRRVIFRFWIHPEHRRKGLATRLVKHALLRAKDSAAEVAQVNTPEDNLIARRMLDKLRFECVRRFLKLRLDMARLNLQEASDAARQCSHLKPGEEDKLTEIQNLSFAEHWGYNPNTLETTTYRMKLGQRSPEDVMVTYDDGRITGYCWTETMEGGKGEIYMLGVAPDYRGRGIGRRLLLAGLAHLKSKGSRVVGLTVDSENAEAISLYRSIGFDVAASSLWYEKKVN